MRAKLCEGKEGCYVMRRSQHVWGLRSLDAFCTGHVAFAAAGTRIHARPDGGRLLASQLYSVAYTRMNAGTQRADYDAPNHHGPAARQYPQVAGTTQGALLRASREIGTA